MRVLLVSHTYCAPINHAKLESLAAHVDLTLLAPRNWQDTLFVIRPDTQPRLYQQRFLWVGLNGRLMYHVYSPRQLATILQSTRPEVVYVEEEPLSLVFAEFAAFKKYFGYHLVGFTWENLKQHYGFPGLARYTLSHADGFIAGNTEAKEVLRWRGYCGPITVTPQLGLDPDFFRPQRNEALRQTLNLPGFTVGYVGRMVAEKGLCTLLRAVARVPEITLVMVGQGPLLPQLHALTQQLNIESRVRWQNTVPHEQIPAWLNSFDALVLPSEPAPRWKEQFGHVLIESMACGVPVIGSDSGAIPEVIGDAGLIFHAGDETTLQTALQKLQYNSELRAYLAQHGRERVLTHYTHAHIAAVNAAFLRQVSKK